MIIILLIIFFSILIIYQIYEYVFEKVIEGFVEGNENCQADTIDDKINQINQKLNSYDQKFSQVDSQFGSWDAFLKQVQSNTDRITDIEENEKQKAEAVANVQVGNPDDYSQLNE